MGMLRPNMGNANYCSAGQLSPLLNDPYYRTIGIGTRIFLGGGGRVRLLAGTQHDPCGARNEHGVPQGRLRGPSGRRRRHEADVHASSSAARPSAATALSLAVGIGIPIPILDEEMARFTGVSDADISAPVIDYGQAYPEAIPANARAT